MSVNAIGSGQEDNSVDKLKKFKQFYGMMKSNPQVAVSLFSNMIQGNVQELPGLLNGNSAAANL